VGGKKESRQREKGGKVEMHATSEQKKVTLRRYRNKRQTIRKGRKIGKKDM